MSLKACPNCGLVAAAGTKFCMECGTPIGGVEEPVQVVAVPQPAAPVVASTVDPNMCGSLLLRRKQCYQGWAVPLTVVVDGREYTFTNGQEMTLKLTPGVHHVLWRFWCRSDQEVYVTVQSGGYYFVEFVVDWVWGGFKMNPESKIS